MTSTALLVLNPRHIPECMAAIKALDIPTCWLSYMPEPKAAEAASQAIQATSFDRYVILSDDTVPTQDTLDLICHTADQAHPAVTGYCNLDENDYKDIVNLTTNPLTPPPPTSRSYHLMTRAQVEQHGHGTPVPTTFAGLSLTLLTRDLLLEHPLRTTVNGGQMDYDLSYRLAQSGIPIVAPAGAYVHHVKERWSHMDSNPQKRLLVGHRTPKVTWTNLEVPA